MRHFIDLDFSRGQVGRFSTIKFKTILESHMRDVYGYGKIMTYHLIEGLLNRKNG